VDFLILIVEKVKNFRSALVTGFVIQWFGVKLLQEVLLKLNGT